MLLIFFLDVADDARDNAQSDTKNKPERDRGDIWNNYNFIQVIVKILFI